jgi:Fe2+ transport system protein FeoA
MTLLEARRDRPVRILEIADDSSRAQCIRFGIGEGTIVESAERLLLGPVLVRHHDQEICLGRGLARRILVEQVAAS